MALLADVLDETKQRAVVEATKVAVEQAVEKVAGPAVLTTPGLLAMFQQYQQDTQQVLTQQAGIINEQSTVIQQLSGTLAAVQNALPTQITNALSAYNTSVVAPLLQQQAATTAGLGALTTTVNSNATAATAALATKAMAADLTALTTTVGTKAAATDLQALTTTVAAKALATDLATTNSNVAANTSAIALRATTAALTTERGRIDGLLNTTVPALQADTALRLLKTGDVATGSIMVPAATLAAAAPRLDQTYGGLNAPIRFATAVGATATAMQPGPLTDPTPQGRKAKPYFVVLTMRTAPAIGATIMVGTTPGGAEVFTKTYTLALLPGLNAVLAPMQPIFIELPAGTTLYAKATAGTWDVEVLSYYKS